MVCVCLSSVGRWVKQTCVTTSEDHERAIKPCVHAVQNSHSLVPYRTPCRRHPGGRAQAERERGTSRSAASISRNVPYMSTLVSVLRSTGARLREPGVWEAWTPHKEPISAAHPRGESCVFAPWPRRSKARAKVPQRLCLRNVSSDLLSADVKKGHLQPECVNLVESIGRSTVLVGLPG